MSLILHEESLTASEYSLLNDVKSNGKEKQPTTMKNTKYDSKCTHTLSNAWLKYFPLK